MPKGRTEKYAIWRSCERMGVAPPDIRAGASYDDLEPWQQASLIAYGQVRDVEEFEDKKAFAGVK